MCLLNRDHTVLFLAILVGLASPSVRAANMVVNPGFETGDFTGWTTTPAAGTGCSSFQVSQYGYAHTGTYGAGFGGNCTTYDAVQQTLTTTPGQSYQLNFWVKTVQNGPRDFQVYWNGSLILDLSGAGNGVYTQHSFPSLVATGSSTVLKFQGYNNPTHDLFDDIFVDISTPTSIPAMSSWALAILGILLAGFSALLLAKGRRRQAQA